MGDLAAISELVPLERSPIHLSMEHTQAPGQVEVMPRVVDLGTIQGRHVNRETYLPTHQKIAQQPGSLDRDGNLCFLGRGAQVRSHQDQGMTNQGMISGRRFNLKHVDRGSGNLAGVKRLEQSALVDQAASSAVDEPYRRLDKRKLAGTDQVPGLGGHGRVQGYEIASTPDIVKPRDARDAVLELPCRPPGRDRIQVL